MASLLDGKVSSDDVQRTRDIRNHPQYEDGFGDDSSLGGDGDIFDMDDLFNDGDGGFGGTGGGTDPFGFSPAPAAGGAAASPMTNNFGMNGNGFGETNFGGQSTGVGGFGPFATSPFNAQPAQAQQPPQKDALDQVMDAGAEAAKSLGVIIVDMFKSFKTRNADDFGFLSTKLITVGGGMFGAGLFFGLLGTLSSIRFLSFAGFSSQLMISGVLSLSTGLIGLGTAAFILAKAGEDEAGVFDDLSDLPAGDDNFTDEYSDNIGDELDDLFSDDFDDLLDDDDFLKDVDTEEPEEEPDDIDEDPEEIDFATELEKIGENKLINRQTLFEAFSSMFPKSTPKFADKKEIKPDSKDFDILLTICLKALANLTGNTPEELGEQTSIEEANESFFSYEIKLKRINKVKKTDELAREIEVYMRESSDDSKVNAAVTIEGDFYKIVVTKGVTAVVTFGDVFKQKYCADFFLDTKNKLPIISGIDELGNVVLDDAKVFDTMLIAGKPRSGKSWYLLSILMCLMLFNSPEEVQFIIVDPKESNLFKTMALLPHVCGLHTDSNILEVLDDIIDIEAPRRKKLLADNRCDDIWAIRKKGIMLPILYLVIDEYMTVVGNLDSDKDKRKDFDGKIRILISQLPSLGIRLLFVPHRATGVVDKTNRTMLQFTAAVRANTDDVIDTLGVKRWDRALTQLGDIAYKSSSSNNAKYVRGAALTTDDGDNSIFIESAAKAFYKMGVDIPDMHNMKIACNRDDNYIQRELGCSNGNRIQYSVDSKPVELLHADNVFDDLDDMDFSDI